MLAHSKETNRYHARAMRGRRVAKLGGTSRDVVLRTKGCSVSPDKADKGNPNSKGKGSVKQNRLVL